MGSLEGDSDGLAAMEEEAQTAQPLLYVNSRRRALPDNCAHRTLLEYLRGIGLTGTKLGCGEGGCGACTVMVSHFDRSQHAIVHRAVNACLTPLYSVEGMHVITVEGIGNCQQGMHHVQEVLANAHGSQCGFCTPGFVMSMYALLRSSKEPPLQQEIEESLSGNLCRCTGYRPILNAFSVFAKTDNAAYKNYSETKSEQLPIVTDTNIASSIVCPSTGQPCECLQKAACNRQEETRNPFESDLGELTFPQELHFRKAYPLVLRGPQGLKWFRPVKLKDVLNLKFRYPDAKLIVGNTEVGIETRFKNMQYSCLISTTHVPELNRIMTKKDGLEIGASVTLSRFLKALQDCVCERKLYEISSFVAFIEQLRWFAGSQIRNVASVGGNICTASPISDLNPLWMAVNAIFTVVDHKERFRIIAARDFFTGYRKTALEKTEILCSVFLPWTRKYEYVKEFKQAHRRDDDIAIVNSGMRVLLYESGGSWLVAEASLAYGGVAPTSLCATKTEASLKGKEWTVETLNHAIKQLQEEILIPDNAPGGMVEFRHSLILSFFFKFFVYIAFKLEEETNFYLGLHERYRSAAIAYQRPISHGTQKFQVSESRTAIGQPVMHLSAKLQVTGEAEYTDDLPLPPGGLHAALVLSMKPHARLISIDDAEAKTVSGFEGFFAAKDVPGRNDIGPVIADEELFASEVVTCVGQVIGIVVADTYENAKAAARKVRIEYEELPAILSIEDAIRTDSFHVGTDRMLEKGNVDECFTEGSCDHVIEGEVRVGGQEHFYLEPNTTVIWTADGGNEVIMVSSTQAPQKHQKFVAHVLGLPMNKVVCKTKRIGGGFGGKETRSAFIAAAAAVPAYLLRKPVRITLDRDIDMLITGQRHPFLGKYKVGFTNAGKILALDLNIFNNGGNSLDLSLSVLDRAMFHSDNVYDIPNVRICGRVCFTNLSSNTAFRGFGGPQGMLIAENWIEHIALILHMHPEEIRELNFQREGYELHYGQQLEQCRIQQVWNELNASCEFRKRKENAEKFNLENRWRKRGLAMVPTKFGISFTTKFLNQAGALVQVYTDGTVLITHGGVEMGQGLHTKVAQVAAACFSIPLSSVFISETSTDKVPNSSPTAASASSDMYGAAVLDACEQIKARMEPLASMKPYTSFADLANACYMDRIDLSAHGFYKTPDIGFDWNSGKGRPFNYFTFGAASAEVEIDTLTGGFHLERVDIVMDLGNSLNPAIDIGQVEGAFVQGLGWVALEEVKWGDGAHLWIKSGHLFTQGPGTYKLPTANDVPVDFRVSLLKDVPNTRAIHSSKAVGEPPLFLASAAFFAIKNAILAARLESGYDGFFVLDSPATPERIRMACADEFTHLIASHHFRPLLSI